MKATMINLFKTTTFAAVSAVMLLGSAPLGSGAVFAKYDGVDGESKDTNHDKWIDVLSIDWGIHRPGGGMTGATRRRGAAVVEDLTLTIEYEKATPKLQEKCLKGEIIPKLEIEQTSTYGGARATYLKYELTNVLITSVKMRAEAGDDGETGTVVVGCIFDEIKVTYTEIDRESGRAKGNVEYSWKIEEGEG